MVRPAIKEENEENTELLKYENEEKLGLEEQAKEVDEEYEDIFRNMQTIGEVTKRKRKDTEGEKKKRRKKKSGKAELVSES